MLEGGLGTLITYNPVTVSHDATLEDVLPHFQHEVIHHLPVVDKEERLVGMLSASDLKRQGANSSPAVASTRPWSLSVGQFMTEDVFTLDHGASAQNALQLMLQHQVHSAPVVENGRLVGIVTSSDFLRELLYGQPPLAGDEIGDWMQNADSRVQAEASLAVAVRNMAALKAAYAVVLHCKDVLGVVSGFQLGEAVQAHPACDYDVAKVADHTIAVPPLKPSDTVAAAARLMLEHNAPAVPIVNREHGLVGLVTQDDLLRAVAMRGMQQ